MCMSEYNSIMCSKPVEINEDHPNENKQSLFIQSKEVSHHHLHLAETQRQAQEQKKLYREKKKRLQVCSDWRLPTWRSWRGLTRRRVSYFGGKSVWGAYWLSLVRPELEVGGGKELGSWQSFTKFQSFWADCGEIGLASLTCCFGDYGSVCFFLAFLFFNFFKSKFS